MILFLVSILTWTQKSLNTLLSLIKILLMSRFGLKLKQATSQSVIIIGNGPSMSKTLEENKEILQKSELITVNNIPSYPIFEELKPQNHCLIDPAFFSFSDRIDLTSTMNALRDKVIWDMNLYVPYHARKSTLIAELKKNKNISIFYVNYVIINGFDWFRWLCFDLNLGCIQCENILAFSTFIALRKGYSTIYLTGADHSWHEQIRLNSENELILEQPHFYETKNEVIHQTKISHIYKSFDSLKRAFFAYDLLQKYAKTKNSSIYNASQKSYIDAFPKVKLSDHFSL